jgi:hypothetical protein
VLQMFFNLKSLGEVARVADIPACCFCQCESLCCCWSRLSTTRARCHSNQRGACSQLTLNMITKYVCYSQLKTMQ